MKIEIKKIEEINGDIVYHVRQDGFLLEAFKGLSGEKEATQYFDKVCARIREGFPKTETLRSVEL